MRVNPDVSSPYEEKLKVRFVEQDQYELRHDSERDFHIIIFNTPRREAIGLFMVVDRFNSTGYIRTDTIGNVSRSPMILRYLQASRDKYNSDHPTWELMWRNCYPIPRGTQIGDIDVKVFKGLQEREGTSSSLDYQTTGNTQWTYLTLTGLDLKSRQGTHRRTIWSMRTFRSNGNLILVSWFSLRANHSPLTRHTKWAARLRPCCKPRWTNCTRTPTPRNGRRPASTIFNLRRNLVPAASN